MMTNLSNAWPWTEDVGDTGEMGAPLLAAYASCLWPQLQRTMLKIDDNTLPFPGQNNIPKLFSLNVCVACA
jgi:hypothetical protein